MCCVWERLGRVWGSEFVLCVGQFVVGVWDRVFAVCGKVWIVSGKREYAVCGIVWNGFGGLILSCVWESLGRVWGSEFVLCVRDFGVGLGNVCLLCVGEIGAG